MNQTGDGLTYISPLSSSGGGGGGATTASEVSYSNSALTDVNNVKKALDNIVAKIYYVKPAITSFTSTPTDGMYEIGTTITAPITFNWSLNKAVTTQTLTDCTLSSVSVRTATYNSNISSNKTFTLSVSDGQNTASSNKTFTFTNKIYYGSSATGTYNDAFVLGLANKPLKTSKAGTYTVNVADGQYFFIAMPTSYNNSDELVGKIGGFETSFNKVATFNHTNSSGYSSSYNVYRSGNHSLGSVSFIV